jgi:hypothetical protein
MIKKMAGYIGPAVFTACLAVILALAIGTAGHVDVVKRVSSNVDGFQLGYAEGLTDGMRVGGCQR